MKELYEYQKTLTKEKKKKLGIVYTPVNIVSFINEKCLERWHSSTPPRVIDFSSGTGVFLFDMASKISEKYQISLQEIYEKYIFANDIDNNATDIFTKFTGCKNVSNTDGLSVDISNYDIIVGNPPYVKIQYLDKNLQKSIRKHKWCEKGNTDLYIAMVERFFKSSKIFGLICPNSWIKSNTGAQMVSDFLEQKSVYHLIDFRGKKVFLEGAYCSILLGDNEKSNSFVFSIDMGAKEETKEYDKASSKDFFLYKKEINFINKINSKKHRLSEFCELKVGLATLSDSVYYLPDCRIINDKVISKGHSFEISATKRCYKAGRLSRYNKTVEDRIIYPYDGNKQILSDKKFKTKHPLAYNYLLKNKQALLNRDKKGCEKKVAAGTMEWFEYGRRQGMRLKDKKILISAIVTKKFFLEIDSGLFISGYCLQMKNNKDIGVVLRAIQLQDFLDWISLNGSPKSGGYFSINKKCVESFRFDKKIV